MKTLKDLLIERIKTLSKQYNTEINNHDFSISVTGLKGELNGINDNIAETLEVIRSLEWEQEVEDEQDEED